MKRIPNSASNTILIIMLLLIPFLHGPVSSLGGTIRIIFEKQQTGNPDTPPLTISLAEDELIPVGCATLLLLLFFYVRKKEKGTEWLDNPSTPDMVMDDEDVMAAWNKVRRLLSDDEES